MLTFFQYFSTVKLNSTCDMAVEKKSEFEQKSENVYAKNENLRTETLDLSKVEISDNSNRNDTLIAKLKGFRGLAFWAGGFNNFL
jgi:hypothetical protein